MQRPACQLSSWEICWQHWSLEPCDGTARLNMTVDARQGLTSKGCLRCCPSALGSYVILKCFVAVYPGKRPVLS